MLIHGRRGFRGPGRGCGKALVAFGPCRDTDTGGCIHFIINNQIGFNQPARNSARSSPYPSDVAKGGG